MRYVWGREQARRLRFQASPELRVGIGGSFRGLKPHGYAVSASAGPWAVRQGLAPAVQPWL